MARNSSLTVGPHADNSTARNDDSPEGKTPEIISSKSATRIEDSVEALDNLEEEIEMIDDLIPKLADISQPSPSILKGKKGVSNSKAVKQKQLAGEESRKAPATKSSNAVAAVNMETPLNSKKVAAQTASKRPAAIRVASNSTQSSSIQGNSAKKPPSATKKRISSVHKPPFVPAKSSKPPTRSNFELPGEGVARKLKEAREVRLKREEEKPQRKIFKARPVRLSQAPVVRLTAASKARISLAKGEAKETSLKPASTLHQNKLPDGSKAKRQSTLAVAECKGLPSTNPSGRTSGRLSTGATATSGKVSAPRPARTSLSAADAAQSKLKGKEVFNRGRVEQQERNQMRRNQETAAKKARAEAAERGRIASREWAEKQRARRLAAQNSNREIGKGV